MFRFLLCLLLLSFSHASFACKFFVHHFAVDSGAADWYSDIVTDAYCKRYPIDKFKIVVINNAGTNSIHSIGFASAFISYRYSDLDQIKIIPDGDLLASTSTDSGDRTFGRAEELRRETSRRAVANLMSKIK